ncbi:V-type ATPase [Mitosporidium daphniae]|uniref:V-type ATPase n=1 Tax=Mitosporidium daphniae TaxID=1485682 RepID=A0A098VYY6_9MICR|nr:V-type ATPase [Mitosporidium daphniae]KGG52926.1 V-type ATPase [Mitosporidium daphniae]|eukprot:XP_013239362.1 V-type ATPase [Mitosporidium daphniae]
MSSTSIHNSQGIQILLEAEKEAKKIIADGRECRIRICLYPLDRTRRLKEAKTEAMQEILALKEAKKQEIIEAEQKVFFATNFSIPQCFAIQSQGKRSFPPN